ncbi:MAG TPA: hypothetical protein VGB91_07275, partial [Rhizomicrobium sp.]
RRDDVIGVLVKCTDLAEVHARLACYDQEAPALRAAAEAPSVPPPPEPVPAAPPPEPAAPPPQGSFLSALDPFGSEAPPPLAAQMAYQPAGQEILPITIKLADYAVEPSGNFTVTLANGQVWRERKEHYETPRFQADGDNYVTIERGLLGGYNLYLKGSGHVYKVMRIK